MEPIHILTATGVVTSDGNRSLTFCNERFEYGTDSDSYVVGNYSGARGATCADCVTTYVSRYRRSAESDVAILRSVGKNNQADFLAGFLTSEGVA